jgi:inhibitor of cysteine peptidase
MNKLFITVIIGVLALALLVAGCENGDTVVPPSPKPTSSVPALNGGQEAKTLELTEDAFRSENNIVRNIELIRPGSLIVSLGSNPTTGYSWGEAEISNSSAVAQVSREFVGSQQDAGKPIMVGAGGKDVIVFDSIASGTATIKLSYGQPWAGGEKGDWTLTINVTVK